MQRLSVTVRLNGIDIQFDQAAYVRLEDYLKDAADTLKGNPDRAEILGDLEQAVADKCLARTGSAQRPVTLADLEPVLADIGSVQDAGTPDPTVSGGARRLEQISEGAVLSGVCLGIARYFAVDVTLVRVIAVLLLIFSGGSMILVYAVLMLLLPFAPLQPGGGPVRRIPRKSREFVEFLRSKVSTAAG